MQNEQLAHAYRHAVRAIVDKLSENTKIMRFEEPIARIQTKQFGTLQKICFLGTQHTHMLTSHENNRYYTWKISNSCMESKFTLNNDLGECTRILPLEDSFVVLDFPSQCIVYNWRACRVHSTQSQSFDALYTSLVFGRYIVRNVSFTKSSISDGITGEVFGKLYGCAGALYIYDEENLFTNDSKLFNINTGLLTPIDGLPSSDYVHVLSNSKFVAEHGDRCAVFTTTPDMYASAEVLYDVRLTHHGSFAKIITPINSQYVLCCAYNDVYSTKNLLLWNVDKNLFEHYGACNYTYATFDASYSHILGVLAVEVDETEVVLHRIVFTSDPSVSTIGERLQANVAFLDVRVLAAVEYYNEFETEWPDFD
jgi:hypothetical protein